MATPDQLLGSGRADPPPLSARGPGALRDTADRAEPRPTAPRLSVACERREGVVVLALEGPLDVYTVRAFRQLVEPFGPATVQMIIDLTGVTLVDSAGLGALIGLRNEAHRGGGRLGLVCSDRRMLRFFGLAGVSDSFAFATDPATTRPAAGFAGRAARPVGAARGARGGRDRRFSHGNLRRREPWSGGSRAART
jgi:anti-sigma B factor antagonist